MTSNPIPSITQPSDIQYTKIKVSVTNFIELAGCTIPHDLPLTVQVWVPVEMPVAAGVMMSPTPQAVCISTLYSSSACHDHPQKWPINKTTKKSGPRTPEPADDDDDGSVPTATTSKGPRSDPTRHLGFIDLTLPHGNDTVTPFTTSGGSRGRSRHLGFIDLTLPEKDDITPGMVIDLTEE